MSCESNEMTAQMVCLTPLVEFKSAQAASNSQRPCSDQFRGNLGKREQRVLYVKQPKQKEVKKHEDENDERAIGFVPRPFRCLGSLG